jgi:hypothetical protein
MGRLITLESLEGSPGRVLAAIGTLFAVAYVSTIALVPRAHGRILNGDSIQYYAYLRSLAIDHDLDFTNDYELLYRPTADGAAGSSVWLTSKTPTGRATNLMSIGPALLWSPFFLLTYGALLLVRPFGIAVPLDGIAAPFPLSAGIAGVAYASLGAYFCYKACRLLVPAAASFWATLVGWLATPALYYSLVSPAYAHAPSLFASALFYYVWLRTRGQSGSLRFVSLGLLAGLAALMRWQDVTILAFPLLELLWDAWRRELPVPRAARNAGLMLGGLAIMILPQLLAWRVIYGRMFVIPQGERFMQWTAPAMIPVLFSLRHGLFSWTPAVLLAVCGFAPLVRRDRFVGWSAVLVFLVTVYVNGAVSDWWAGEAFGARRFIGETVLFTIGLGAIFASPFWQDRRRLLRWTAVALIAYNLLFLLQYEVFMWGYRDLSPYPTTVRQVLIDRVLLPWHLLARWIR